VHLYAAERQRNIAASGVAKRGWATLLAAGGDLANLGISVERMWNLMETKVSTLARTVRDVKERKTTSAPSGEPTRQEALDVFLQAKKAEFTNGLVDALNGLLSTAVYSPLVSYSTALTSDMVVSSLPPHSKVEAWASFPGHLSKVLDHEADVNTAHYDEILRAFRGAEAAKNFDALPPEQQAELRGDKVEGTGDQTLGDLELQYKGCKLKVYCDGQHRFYVQRPPRDEYSQAARENKPPGEPEFVA